MPEEILDDESLLVLRLGSLGDVANVLPAVAAVRALEPDLRIEWLVEESSSALVTASRVADEVIVFPRREPGRLWRSPLSWPRAVREALRLARKLRAKKFVYVLDFQGNLKSGLLSAASGAPMRFGFARGFCREMNWLFNNILAAPITRKMLRAEKNAALAQAFLPEVGLRSLNILEDAEQAAPARAFLGSVAGDGPLVILHPGTSAFGRFKRWPAERYGLLAAQLTAQFGARCIVTRGPSEEGLADEVVAASHGAARKAPLFALGELIELLRRARLVVAGDTGPLHVAALLQRPVAAIFGPKDPAVYAPYGTRSRVVRVEMDCSPCDRRRCDHAGCIMRIEVEQVRAAAAELLNDAER